MPSTHHFVGSTHHVVTPTRRGDGAGDQTRTSDSAWEAGLAGDLLSSLRVSGSPKKRALPDPSSGAAAFNCAATDGTSLRHNVLHGALRGVSLAYVALRHRQTPQNLHQHLRVNPRRNLTIAEFPDASAARPIGYVGTLVVSH
jgi:hypothetical protein